MSQLYVPDGALTTCLSGKSNSSIKVQSQSKTKINGKLKATEEDRFSDNFYCQKMVNGSSALMGMVGMAAGVLAGPVGAFVGLLAGKLAGALLGNTTRFVPSLCSTLCKPSKWTVVHPKVKIEGRKALMEKANLRCMLGGTIFIVLPNINRVLTMMKLADDTYRHDLSDDPNAADPGEIDGYNEVSPERAKEILGDDWKTLLNQDEDNGFYARLYEDANGNVVIAYRGTDPHNISTIIKDGGEDYMQAMGISSRQYEASVDLAKKVQEAQNKGRIQGGVEITGHSLGGGLATIAGAATGYPTYTYNAAAVHQSSYDKYGVDKSNARHIQAYVGDKDPLNLAQDNREAILAGGTLVAPTLPVIGTAAGSLGHVAGPVVGAVTTTTGGDIGLGAGVFLGGSGIWGMMNGGLPRQDGVQRISVPQDCTIGEGHSIGEFFEEGLRKIQSEQGAGDPVVAEMAIPPGSLSRKDILTDLAVEKMNEVKEELIEFGNEVKDKAVEVGNAVKDKAVEVGTAVRDKAVEVKEKAMETGTAVKEKVAETTDKIKSFFLDEKEEGS